MFFNTHNTSKYQFTFVFSTGRCGTTHLARIFGDENSVVIHEDVFDKTSFVLSNFLRPIAINNDRKLAINYVKNKKIPFIVNKLKSNKAINFMETGHLIIYGIAPFLLTYLKNVKFIRLRRDRYETALSFMTRPEEFDIWNKEPHQSPYRWSMHPFDEINVLPVPTQSWNEFHRFQKYLWSVDEVERKWQRLIKCFSFPYLEINTEEFSLSTYEQIKDFTSISFNKSQIGIKHNSTIEKGIKKPAMTKDEMQELDLDYQKILNHKGKL